MRYLILVVLTACNCGPHHVRLSPSQQAYTAVLVEACLHGSGVLLDSRRVITAAHVIKCAEGTAITVTHRKEKVSARIDKIDDTAGVDLAILVLAEPRRANPIAIGQTPLVDDVVCVEPQHPNELRACGWVSTVFDGRFAFSAFVQPGNSGSGIWDSRGRLVGIATNMDYERWQSFHTTDAGKLERYGGDQVVGGVGTALWTRRDWL